MTSYSFPGRWFGGLALTLGPLLVLAGLLLRIRFHYFFPQQLAAYAAHPALLVAAYSLFTAGMVVLAPAVAALARIIGRTHPVWAAWGAGLVILGLFTRTFHGGIDHLAFQLVRVQGLDAATRAVADSYGAWHLFRTPALAIMAGWVVLAVGAYRSRALSRPRAVALGLMSALALGTLKGTEVPQSLIAVGGLCYALVPLGVAVLRDGPRPTRRAVIGMVSLTVALVLLFFFGPTG
ncbi:hypothetical protein ONA91_21195 [Micromonospora sp. DR5-3]|uniref:hypothetical protein n=1 Tax=Micromonospora sp. DR5-3 TaxID=2992129 RepID=UPI00222EAA6A|nr:hypothetical protein [Micromonospora sp. DR5-3]MCW3816967.1 hypothetical protein [Micromonospora sp. DR5-3]